MSTRLAISVPLVYIGLRKPGRVTESSHNDGDVPSEWVGKVYPKSHRFTRPHVPDPGCHSWVSMALSRWVPKNVGVICEQVVAAASQYWSHGVSGQFPQFAGTDGLQAVSEARQRLAAR